MANVHQAQHCKFYSVRLCRVLMKLPFDLYQRSLCLSLQRMSQVSKVSQVSGHGRHGLDPPLRLSREGSSHGGIDRLPAPLVQPQLV